MFPVLLLIMIIMRTLSNVKASRQDALFDENQAGRGSDEK